MARLSNEPRPVSGNYSPSDHIISPQPRAPRSKEHLISLETSHMPDSDNRSVTDGMPAPEYEYSSSGSSARHSTGDLFGRDMDDELLLKSRASSRSSMSSVPASVLVHPNKQSKSMALHEKIAGYTIEDEESFGDFDDLPRSMRTLRPREAGFRKPSSVRAMQMNTEDEADEDEYLTPPRRRLGTRSPGHSSLRRSPYYSPKSSPEKPKPKKEIPLVLLHCNLLPPSIPVRGAADPQNQALVEEVLPPQYWKRWRRLQEKVGASVVRDRGVLISHPEDLYDMLEERLLESLELQRARVNQGHFLGHEDSGPGSEGEVSDRGESDTDGEQGDECPDCGGRVLGHSDKNRKWEIRVYAANGLMRAGAWAAAWRGMEKVDVEVGLWLPSELRRALEKRITEERSPNVGGQLLLTAADDSARSAVALRSTLNMESSNAPSEIRSLKLDAPPAMPAITAPTEPATFSERAPIKEHEIALPTLMINYIRVLAKDRRNIALVVMSVLIVFLSIVAGPQFANYQSLTHALHDEEIPLLATPRVDMIALSTSMALEDSSSPVVVAAQQPLEQTIPDEIPTESSDVLHEAGPVKEPETEATQEMEENFEQKAADDVMDSTVSESSEDPVESVEAPVEASVEAPVEEPVDEPVKEPVQEPVQEVVEAPAEMSVEEAGEESVEQPGREDEPPNTVEPDMFEQDLDEEPMEDQTTLKDLKPTVEPEAFDSEVDFEPLAYSDPEPESKTMMIESLEEHALDVSVSEVTPDAGVESKVKFCANFEDLEGTSPQHTMEEEVSAAGLEYTAAETQSQLGKEPVIEVQEEGGVADDVEASEVHEISQH